MSESCQSVRRSVLLLGFEGFMWGCTGAEDPHMCCGARQEPPSLGSGVQDNGGWYFRLLQSHVEKGCHVKWQLVPTFPDPHLSSSWHRTRMPHKVLKIAFLTSSSQRPALGPGAAYGEWTPVRHRLGYPACL